MVIAYARVSTKEQNLDRQLEALEKAGCEKIFQEKASGKNRERPALKEALGSLREGDTLLCESISRLARSMADLFKIVEEIQEKGANIRFLKEKDIDTTTATGTFIFSVLASLAQFERSIIRERQAEGIAIAKKQGKFKGRPALPIPSSFEKTLKRVLAGEINNTEAYKILGISRARFYRLKESYKETVGGK